MSEDTTPDVLVIDPDPEPEPSVETGDTTVIVEAPEPDDEPEPDIGMDPLTERLVNLERDVEELRTRIEEVSAHAFIAEATAEDALDTAEEVSEESAEVLDAVDETVDDLEDSIEDADVEKNEDGELEIELPHDTEPASARVHPLFRSFGDWRGN